MSTRAARSRRDRLVVAAALAALLGGQALARLGAQAAHEVLTLQVDSVSFGGMLLPSLTDYAGFSVTLAAEAGGAVLFQATGGRGGTFAVRYTPRGAP